MFEGYGVNGKLKLGSKFTLLLTIVFFGIVLSGITLSGAMQRKVEDEIMSKAQILDEIYSSLDSCKQGVR
ncbi:hypothetical protein NUACC26_016390 [Scytonema sp. NUACC26]